ncbi:iron-containing alcohol dehydrogenase [Pseudopedobacter saltans DSM 12145]|uniref:Iron-containing alcohol dehydrogenase n=1 Tax=Pseudopedobacter saltans (strain ATCC 51119 / DSM 12145 / JCM 21818 / CCUG 39354 / LMG 10337 / NBRC 100064 / NCIMB 13643) TaxID=762903 RepID=F0S4F3_PSESL|nr:iron-containing alcohol dehydrogenase [Pseudopedobacter saltans]ADY50910.1 iron-containing alcohol dehydrogenase [Pseudopedobacter saltans DSM 12145]
MSINRILKVSFPNKLVFGNGVMTQLAEELIQLNCKEVILLTIKPLQSQLAGFIDELQKNNIVVITDTSIEQEPTFADFRRILSELKNSNADTVIGIGGGSVLDVAKLVAAQLDNTQTLEEIVGNGLLKGRSKRLICVPATSGTGSEVSPNAILVDDENQKKGIISPYLVPDMVYADPLLTLSLPASITAATGLDALTHCLEAFTNKFSQPFIDMYAFEGMRLIAANLEEAVKNGQNKEARSEVALGSILGGFCLGPVNTAGVHALSYPLGSMFHLPHGLSNALLLPYVMEFNYTANPKKYAEVAIALGCRRENTDEETAVAGIAKIKQLIQACGIPARLRDLNIPQESIPQMAEDAMKITRLLVNNPREITLSDAICIFNAAY